MNNDHENLSLTEKLHNIKFREDINKTKTYFSAGNDDDAAIIAVSGMNTEEPLSGVKDWGRWYGVGRDNPGKDPMYVQIDGLPEHGLSTLGGTYTDVNPEDNRDVSDIFLVKKENGEVNDTESIKKVKHFIAKEILGFEDNTIIDEDDNAVITFLLQNFNQAGMGSVLETTICAMHNTGQEPNLIQPDKTKKKVHLTYNSTDKSLTIKEECTLIARDRNLGAINGEMNVTTTYTFPVSVMRTRNQANEVRNQANEVARITPSRFDIHITKASGTLKSIDERTIGERVKAYLNTILKHWFGRAEQPVAVIPPALQVEPVVRLPTPTSNEETDSRRDTIRQ